MTKGLGGANHTPTQPPEASEHRDGGYLGMSLTEMLKSCQGNVSRVPAHHVEQLLAGAG